MSKNTSKEIHSTTNTHICQSTTTPINSDTISYDGTTYHVPHVDKAQHGISYLAIKTCREYITICDSCDDEPPYYEACDNNPIAICLNTGGDDDCNTQSSPIFLSIFQAGCSQAIATCRARRNISFESRFNTKKSILPAGDYLLVISGVCDPGHPYLSCCGNHTIYPFHLLSPHGETSIPCITAHTDTGCDSLLGTNCPITVELTFDTDYNGYNRYHIICIDSSCRRVGATDYYIRPRKKGEKLSFGFCPDLFWSGNGHYTLILTQNSDFTTAVSLSLANKSGLSTDDTPDGKILRAIAHIEDYEKLSFHWFNLLPGLSAIRKRVFALYYKRMLYNKLKANGIADYTTQASNIVVTTNDCSRSTYASTIIRLAGTLQGSIKEIDLSNSYTNNGDDTFRNNSQPLAFFEGENVTYLLKNLSAAFSPSGRTIIDKMRQHLYKGEQIVLLGTPVETRRLFELYPDIEPYFAPEYRFTIEVNDIDDILYTIAQHLKSRGGIRLGDNALTKLYTFLAESQTNGTLPDFKSNELQEYACRLEQELHKKLQSMHINDITAHPEVACTITADEIDTPSLLRTGSITQYLTELRQMIGLQAMKETIETITLRTMWEQKCRQLGATNTPVTSPHMIFTGNPGTGKTTVAKMTGRIFHALGLLSKGNVITAERSSLVGRYIGETERNMQELLLRARGNVLFIDEAYTLCDTTQDRKDFGYRVIESLLTALATADSDMVVILAGYEEEMEQMINANVGLRGRFPHIVRFDDYTADELMQIGRQFIQKNGCYISDEAADALRQIVTEAVACRDRYFSNARWMEQLITSHILPAVAQRTLRDKKANDLTYYRTIEATDIAAIRPSLKIASTRPTPYNSIGFRA